MPKQVWRGAALLAPVPLAMVTCGHQGIANIITVAWTGIASSSPPKTYVSIKPSRYSHEMIKQSGVFVINLTTRQLARAADTCGVKSGRDFDKFKELGLTHVPSPNVGCPMLVESPVSLECRVCDILPLGSHDMFLADILSVCVEDQFINEGGRLRLDKADIISYAHGSYYTLGTFLGGFGFSVMKKKTAKRKRQK
jgi:flavin reductase (DIM6/NTAB) family NADH-FMN oxidoreductase RutF